MLDNCPNKCVCALRAITFSESTTADTRAFSHEFFICATIHFPSEVRGINPAVYDVTSNYKSVRAMACRAGVSFFNRYKMNIVVKKDGTK